MKQVSSVADPIEEQLMALQARGASIVHAGRLSHDPLAELTELSLDLTVLMVKAMKRTESAAARPFVMAEDDMRKLWAFARREAGRGMVRIPSWRWVAVGIAALVAVALIAGAGAYAAAGGFSTKCQAQQGGVVCFRWVVPPAS